MASSRHRGDVSLFGDLEPLANEYPEVVIRAL